MNRIPNLLPIRVAGFRLVDARTISDFDERRRALSFGRKSLDELIRKTRPGVNRCDENFASAHQAAGKALLSSDPGSTVADLQAVSVGPSECDRRLEQKALAIYRGDSTDLVGVFFLYNLRVETESASLIQITVYPAPGIRHESDRQWADDVGVIKRRLLDEDSPLEDGRDLDVLKWQYPIDGPREWAGGGEPWAALLIAELKADGYQREDVDGCLRSIKRKSRAGRP